MSESDGGEFLGHVWLVLDVTLHPTTQRSTGCLIIESVRSTRDARDNRGGVRSRTVSHSEWAGAGAGSGSGMGKGPGLEWVIGRLVTEA